MTNTKTKLEWPDLWNHLGLTRDNGGRWYAGADAAKITLDYIEAGGYRTPSRAWPKSHATPLLTAKFAKYLVANDQALAAQCGLI